MYRDNVLFLMIDQADHYKSSITELRRVLGPGDVIDSLTYCS